jgi:hypothetical protein
LNPLEQDKGITKKSNWRFFEIRVYPGFENFLALAAAAKLPAPDL